MNELNLIGELVINKIIIEVDFDEEVMYVFNLVMCGIIVVDGYGLMKVFCVGDVMEIGKVVC